MQGFLNTRIAPGSQISRLNRDVGVHLPTVVIDRLRVRIDKNTRVTLLLLRFDFWRGEVGHQFGVRGHAEAVEHVFGNRY